MSNPNNVRQFLKRWEGEEGDLEERLGDGGEREGEEEDLEERLGDGGEREGGREG